MSSRTPASVDDRPASAPPPRLRTRRPTADAAIPARLPLLAAVLVSAASGMVLAAAFPSPNIWILAFVGVGGMLAALRGRRFWSGFLVGLAGGLAFWFSLIPWITLFLGLAPLLALGALEALFMAAGAGLIAVAYRAVAVLYPGRFGRTVVAPLLVAAAWTCREAVSGNWPYGGFAWGRIAQSQSTSPFAHLAAWFGVTGMTFVLVWLSAFALACCIEPIAGFGSLPGRERTLARRWAVYGRALAAVLAVTAVLAIPMFRPSETGTFRVAAIQAVTPSGYFQHRDYDGQILDENVAATLGVAGKGVQLVVWPEGASDISPLASAAVQEKWNSISLLAGAPLLAGAITDRGGKTYNSSLLWQANQGVTDVYDKVRPVPFGEYVPDRSFWTPFAPSLLALIGRDYTPGTGDGVMSVGGTTIGVDICFDIVDDALFTTAVQHGAELLVAQTNNADFGHTEENEQQLAIARLRAIETGRTVVSDSTVASTTVIGPDGATIAAAKPFVKTALVVDAPLATGTTPAVAFGLPLGFTIALLGGVLPVMLALIARRRRG